MEVEFVDYYELLEIEPTASVVDIKQAIKNCLRKYHPDKNAKTEDEIKRCTKKTAQVNNAKDILLDPSKRRLYDQQWEAERNGDRDEQPPEDDYDHEEPVLRFVRYVPGSTCRPYTGDDGPRVFYFGRDGTPGENGLDGIDGRDGTWYGEDGTDGTHATVATNGASGSDLKIFLETVQDIDSGHLEIRVFASSGRDVIARDVEPTFWPIKTFQSVDFSSKGGRGGDGGSGGRGGNGHRGYNGRDATRYSSGGNGGPGGNGGDGGRGTSGGHGGHGGNIEYILDEDDAYLLMRANGIDPLCGSGGRVTGGQGGYAGSHGSGGSGGAGGRGGNSYSWTTTRHGTDGNGNSVTYYDTHTNPGGWPGKRGRDGHTPQLILSPGNQGNDGTVRIQLICDSQSIRTFAKRYDLSFTSSTSHHLSNMIENATFEFGETVHIRAVTLKNSGFMPTPKQRVMLAFAQCNGINPDQETRIMVPSNSSISPGYSVAADQGFLTFACPFPEDFDGSVREFEPRECAGWMTYSADQLGPENKASVAQISDFRAPYTNIHHKKKRDDLQMAFPVENNNGIRGIRALAAQETTFVLLTISNNSNQGFGRTAGTKRLVSVLFQYVQSEIPIQNIQVRSGVSGDVVSVRPGRGDRGYEFDIPFLGAGSDYLVQVSFKLDAKASNSRTCARAALQAKLFLDDIPILQTDGSIMPREAPKRMIQSRLFEVSYQPKFVSSQSEIVIVASTGNDADQIEEWQHLVKRIGLTSQDYSISRYCHLSPLKEVEDMVLRDCLKNKVLVVLNEDFGARPNDKVHRLQRLRPSNLLSSLDDFDVSTQIIIVGGKSCDVGQCLPDYHIPMSNDSRSTLYQNQKSFKRTFMGKLLNERAVGFVEAQRSLPQTFTIKIKARNACGEPTESTKARVLSRRCKKIQKWLDKQENLRSAKVVFASTSTLRINRRCLDVMSTWDIGELHISLGVPSYQRSVVWVSEEEAGQARLSSPNAIRSNSMTYALIKALPLDKQIDCFVRAVGGLAKENTDSQLKALAMISRDCLVTAFLSDISNYYNGRFKVKDRDRRAPTLYHLSKHDSLGALLDEYHSNESTKSVVDDELGSLISSLQCCAGSPDLRPWWNPFSPKHSTHKAMKEAVNSMVSKWSSVLDRIPTQKKEKILREEVQNYIKKQRKKFWIRARGRYRAALEHLHSPTNVKKYPRTSEFGPFSARVRDQQFMSTGSSQKRKKRSTQTISLEELDAVRTDMARSLALSESVRITGADDVQELRPKAIQLSCECAC